jgi:hypothetical protein
MPPHAQWLACTASEQYVLADSFGPDLVEGSEIHVEGEDGAAIPNAEISNVGPTGFDIRIPVPDVPPAPIAPRTAPPVLFTRPVRFMPRRTNAASASAGAQTFGAWP